MATNSSYLHHHSSTRSYTSPQRSYSTPPYQESQSSRRFTAPIHGSYLPASSGHPLERRPSADPVHSSTGPDPSSSGYYHPDSQRYSFEQQPQSFPQPAHRHHHEEQPHSFPQQSSRTRHGAEPLHANSQSNYPRSAMHYHEKAHQHRAAVSAQTRSQSDDSLTLPPPPRGEQLKGGQLRSSSQRSIPSHVADTTRTRPFTHTPATSSSVRHPVNPDPLTTGGSSSSSSSRPPDVRYSGAPSSSRHSQGPSQDPRTTKHLVSRDPAPQIADPPASAAPQRAPRRRSGFSKATLENERYSIDGISRPDHDNEDRDFHREESDFTVLGVFDGHDGSRASGFTSSYMMGLFDMPSWRSIVENADPAMMDQVLTEFFRDTENEFFKSIQRFVDEKESLQRVIPQVSLPLDTLGTGRVCPECKFTILHFQA